MANNPKAATGSRSASVKNRELEKPLTDVTPIESAALDDRWLTSLSSFQLQPSRIIPVTDGLAVRRNLGPVKARITDTSGEPVGSVPVRIEVRSNGEITHSVEAVAGPTGYLSADLSDVELTEVSEVRLLPMVAEGKTVDWDQGVRIDPDRVADGTPAVLTVPKDPAYRIDLTNLREKLGRWTPPTNLDSADVANAPELFSPTVITSNGNCSLDFQSEIALWSQTFHQVVRSEDSGEPRTSRLVADKQKRLGHPFPRELDYAFMEPEGDNPTQAWKAVPGLLNVYTQRWRRVGHGLGSLLYSLALAPCEATKIAILDWQRDEQARRDESLDVEEQLSHTLRRDRSINEAVDSVLEEVQSGSSSSAQASAGISLGPIVLGGGGGSSRSRSRGSRTLTMNTAQDLADRTQQQGSSMRSKRSTVVTSANTSEQERITTRSVRNHNRNHALTVQYFQVVEHFVAETELSQQEDVLLVPYLVPGEIWQPFPEFDLEGSPDAMLAGSGVAQWLDRYGARLYQVLPWQHRMGFKALRRLLHTPEIYEADEPVITASRWTVEMESGLAPGVRLRIETTSGGSYTLRPRQSSEGVSLFTATSSDVDLAELASITVTFDADEAVRRSLENFQRSQPFGSLANLTGDLLERLFGEQMEAHKRFTIDYLRLVAHVEPNRWMSRSRNVEVLSVQPGVELSHETRQHTESLSMPDVDILETRTARYRDYAAARNLAVHVRDHAMDYLKYLWMSENSEERALRFDRFEYGGDPLLELIENKPVGILGNHVAFRLLEQGQLKAARVRDSIKFSRLVTLPSQGVFAETFLSKCNATEPRDVNRMYDPSTRCADEAPDISGISPGGRVGTDIPSPGGMPASVLNVQNAPAAPDPSGLAAAAGVMSQPDLFRDMSLGQATVEAVRSLSQQAVVTSGENQRAAIEALTKLLPMLMGMPPAGGAGGGSGEAATVDAASQGGSAGGGVANSAQGIIDSIHRQSDPVRQRDHEQVIRESDMDSESKKRATRRLHNATGLQAVPESVVRTGTGIADSVADIMATLDYLGVSQADFEAVSGRYFQRLSELLRFAGILGDAESATPLTFGRLVRNFQADQGLTEDGILGADTLFALNEPWARARVLGTRTVAVDDWAPPGQTPGNQFTLDNQTPREDIADAYENLMADIRAAGGVVTSAGAGRALGAGGAGRVTESFHLAHLAVDFATPSGMRASGVTSTVTDDAYVITREGARWRVWAVADQAAERTVDAVWWSGGQVRTEQVTARLFDVTAAAEARGFVGIGPQSRWPGRYDNAEWWHLQHDGDTVPFISQLGPERIRALGPNAVDQEIADGGQAGWDQIRRAIRGLGRSWS